MSRHTFQQDVIDGLCSSPRWLPCKYLYDERGSALFEEICKTEDYYVTRADLEIHRKYSDEIAALIGPDAHIIEFGSGASIKTRLILERLQNPRAYSPIEISESALKDSVKELNRAFDHLDVLPLQADYTQDIDSRHLALTPPARRRIIYFPGSTIGNFTHSEALNFLIRMRRMAGDNGLVMIGVDLLKPISQLIKAYDDHQGITAKFNRNILYRMKKELDAVVAPEAFEHEARFNEELSRIEMHLVAKQPTEIKVSDQSFLFTPGQSIHTESSHKYSVESFQSLAKQAGLASSKLWTDAQTRFSMHCLKPQPG